MVTVYGRNPLETSLEMDLQYTKALSGKPNVVYLIRLDKETTNIKKAVNSEQLTVNSLKNFKTVEVYDLLGRRVKTLPAKAFVNWKEGNGVYVVRLIGSNFKRQTKTLVIR